MTRTGDLILGNNNNNNIFIKTFFFSKILGARKPTNGVLVLVRVDADEDDLAVQLVHDGEEHVRRDHAVQRPDEHRLLRVQTIPRVLNVRRVRHHPRYDLNGLKLFRN